MPIFRKGGEARSHWEGEIWRKSDSKPCRHSGEKKKCRQSMGCGKA